MKAYRSTKLSDAQFKRLQAHIDKCQQYMDNPEFDTHKCNKGFLFWKREVEYYSLRNIPFGLKCYYLQSTSKALLKKEITPSKAGVKLFTLLKMFAGGQEILIDDELYDILYRVVEGDL